MFSMGELITTLECRKTIRVTALDVDQPEVEPTLVTKIKVAPKEGTVWEPGEMGKL